jgi:hypothetical protein
MSRSYSKQRKYSVVGSYSLDTSKAIPVTYITGVTYSLSDTDRKIASFANLRPGWDYGSGGPIPVETRDLALAWNYFLKSLGFLDTDAFPGSDGEVIVAAGYGDHYFEVIIEPNHTISVGYDFKNKQVLYKPQMSPEDAAQLVLQLTGRGETWNLSDYFTRINLAKNDADLVGQLLGTPRPMATYRSWTSHVLTDQELQSASMYENTSPAILASWENPQFFGNLNPIYFHKVTT